MTAKQRAIKRVSVFLSDRVDYAMASGDKLRSGTTKEKIEELLEQEFSDVLEDGEMREIAK